MEKSQVGVAAVGRFSHQKKAQDLLLLSLHFCLIFCPSSLGARHRIGPLLSLSSKNVQAPINTNCNNEQYGGNMLGFKVPLLMS